MAGENPGLGDGDPACGCGDRDRPKPAASAAGADTLDGAAPADFPVPFFIFPLSRYIFHWLLRFSLWLRRLGRPEQLADQLAVSAAWEPCRAVVVVPCRGAVEIRSQYAIASFCRSIRPSVRGSGAEQSRAGTLGSGGGGVAETARKARARRARVRLRSVDWLATGVLGRGRRRRAGTGTRLGWILAAAAGRRAAPGRLLSCGAYGARRNGPLSRT